MQYSEEGYYTSSLLDELGVRHGFGTKKFILRLNRMFVPRTKQVHGTDLRYFKRSDEDVLYTGDAWLTEEPGVVCYVKTADCLPLLVYDKRRNIAGAIHCGWRSIAGRIVGKVIGDLFKKGSRPEDIIAVIGPHIRRDCYEIGDELKNSFRNNGWNEENFFVEKDNGSYFSMSCAVMHELKENGIEDENIDRIQLCTFCEPDKFYSYRRVPAEKGRLINFITLS